MVQLIRKINFLENTEVLSAILCCINTIMSSGDPTLIQVLTTRLLYADLQNLLQEDIVEIVTSVLQNYWKHDSLIGNAIQCDCLSILSKLHLR